MASNVRETPPLHTRMITGIIPCFLGTDNRLGKACCDVAYLVKGSENVNGTEMELND